MRRFIAALALLLAVAGTTASGLAAPATRPNVVLIMPDDVSFGDFSFWTPGGPRTPQLDSLAQQSVRLTDFHVSPTCSPTRAALLTGRYNNATGVWHTILGRYFLRPDETTLADIFTANGYATGLFGKWHLGESYPLRPKDRGFARVVTHRGGGVDQQHNFWGNRDLAPAMIYVDEKLVPMTDDDDGIAGAYSTNFFTARAIDYMRESAARRQPFFVYLPYNVAHSPHDTPPDARPGIDAKTAAIENMDKNIGRVLAFLDRERLADDTLLIFCTDNGGNSSLFRASKGAPYEGGHRVPFLARWKNGGLGGSAAAARDVAALTSHIDVLPTLRDLLGLKAAPNRPAPLPLHGRSLRSLLDPDPANDDPALRRRTVVVDNQRLDQLAQYKQASVMRDEFDASGRIARKWRLVSKPNVAWELYDVVADPKQSKDLAAQPQHAAVIAELKAAYETWWSETSARGGEYIRQLIGHRAEPVSCLYSHDWHTDGNAPWNHTQIAEAQKGNGFNAVEFAQAGSYTFDLRRWPREIADETTATSKLARPISHARTNEPTHGTALPIHSARIRVWHGNNVIVDERKSLAREADGVEFSLAMPAGPAFVQTWFYDAREQEICGAYYTYVSATGANPSRTE